MLMMGTERKLSLQDTASLFYIWVLPNSPSYLNQHLLLAVILYLRM